MGGFPPIFISVNQNKFKQLQTVIITSCYGADKKQLFRNFYALKNNFNAEKFKGLENEVNISIAKVKQRKENLIPANLDLNLPFYSVKSEVSEALSSNQVIVVCGETGSGKTTQLPQICFALGYGATAQIAHTQPRRLAARSVAQRIASESKTELGDKVGYKVRFSEKLSDSSQLIVMTDGMLLSELNQDRFLNQYEVIIIDEAHERSLNIDLLLGVLKKLIQKRKDLKLVITSATIDTQKFSDYFNKAPVINVSGRTYPVEIQYRPIAEKNTDLTLSVIKAIAEINSKSPQDTLVFLPGERFIRDIAEKAKQKFKNNFEILPLFGRLSFSEQQKIFQKSYRAKIVLATNVAETSLTVPGIRYVIDCGLVRMSRYSWRTKTQGLPIEKVSQASANQRSGRCGRVAPGVAIRMYEQEDFENRPDFTDPEILRTNLATVILQMALLKMGKVEDFDFIEAPDSRLIKDGYKLLQEIKAVDNENTVTALGRKISRFALDPSYSKMLLSAHSNQCLHSVMVIVSALSIQDPREVPQDKQQQARECHLQWQHESSDFMAYLNLWNQLEKQKKAQSNNQFRKWCTKNFLAYMRIREWADVMQQLKQTARELKLNSGQENTSEEAIHRSILSGIPSHIASLELEDKKAKQGKNKFIKRKFADYLATRSRALKIFPSSSIKKAPKWLMAASFIQTQHLYAHEVAACDSSWLMQDLQHLHHYEFTEPHLQPRYGRISAYRTTRIYNLIIEARKRVNYASVNVSVAREIFIRQGLVEAQYETNIDFIEDNRDLVNHFQQEENKLRRRDLIIDDEFLFNFYQHRLNEDIIDGPSLEQWVKQAQKEDKSFLRLTQDDVLIKKHEKNEQLYPEYLNIKQQQLTLKYHFEPGSEHDGVSVNLPLMILNQFSDIDFEYLIPAFLEQKIEALIRSLPKQIRKNFVPVPEFASACLDAIDQSKSLCDQISVQLQRMTGVLVEPKDWQPDVIEAHLKMRYRIIEHQHCIAKGRDLKLLKEQLSGQASESFEQQVNPENEHEYQPLMGWDCGDIPDSILLKKTGVKAFPALVDYGEYVLLEYLESRQQADFYHGPAVARLISFELEKMIKPLSKLIFNNSHLMLLYLGLGNKQELLEELIMSSIETCFLETEIPITKIKFDTIINNKKQNFITICNERVDKIQEILKTWRNLQFRLDSVNISQNHLDDIKEQIDYLIYSGFIRDVPVQSLNRYSKYFLAIEKRIDKLLQPMNKLDTNLESVRKYWNFYIQNSENDQIMARDIEAFRWSIEEFRIASFAQPMKAAYPISVTKLDRMIEAMTA